jgi:hypothetical protein
MKTEAMTEDNLNAYLSKEIEDCIGDAIQSDVGASRKKALEYYLNLPRGDEEDYRSQIQDSTVHDTVETLLPGLLAPFLTDEDVVDFVPRQTNDKEGAKKRTKLVNYVIMNDNEGLKIIYQFAKDGLLQKNGFLYVDWLEKNCVTMRTKRGSIMDLQAIQNDPANTIIKVMAEVNDRFVEQKEFAKLPPEQLMQSKFEVKYRERKQEGIVKIVNIPPEHMLVHKDATCLEPPRLIGWREQKTISQLKAEGYSQDKLDQLSNAIDTDDNWDFNGERTTRKLEQGGNTEYNNSQMSDSKTSNLVWVTVLFCYVDYDNDGYTEYRKIIRAGTGSNSKNIVLYNEEIDECPIVWWTPTIMPHQMFGRSLADDGFEVQDMKTALIRGMMNATYDIEPSYVVAEDGCVESTLDDLYNRQPRSLIMVKSPDAIRELSENTPDISNAYQLLQYADLIRETRTGVTKQMQGVDPDILQDKTATEASLQSSASMQVTELKIRLFALGIKDLCVKVDRLLQKYQTEPRWVRIAQDQAPVQTNPQDWDNEVDVIVKVGLGTGTKQQQVQNLMMINNFQTQDLQMQQGNVTPENRMNLYEQFVSLTGLGSASMYFGTGNKDDTQQKMIQDAQAQAFEEGRQAGAQEAAQQLQAEDKQRQAQKDQSDAALKQMDMQMRQQEHSDKMQLEVIKQSDKAKNEQAKIDIETLKLLKEANSNGNENRQSN